MMIRRRGLRCASQVDAPVASAALCNGLTKATLRLNIVVQSRPRDALAKAIPLTRPSRDGADDVAVAHERLHDDGCLNLWTFDADRSLRHRHARIDRFGGDAQ